MRIRVLGPVEVRAAPDEAWLRPPPQQRLVLAALAARPAHARDVDVLADALWGPAPPDNAHRLVQALVSRLRSSLGQVDDQGPLRSVEGGWRLDLERVTTDVVEFDRLADRAIAAAADGDLVAARTAVSDALQLWRGRPFGEFGDESIVVAEALRLEERRLEVLQLRLELQLAEGAHGRVIGELKELLVDHPMREQLWGLLMVALYRAGRQAEALVTFQRVRERLVDQLGTEPGPELQRLHARILRHDLDGDDLDADDPGAVGVVGGTGAGGSWTTAAGPRRPATLRGTPPTRTTFVGRAAELDELGRLVRHHRIVSVVGLGGVGKTRLAIAAAEATMASFRRGGVFVDLTRVEPDRLVTSVAATLGVVETAQQPLVDAVRDHVRRGPILLVLDNAEHVLEELGALVEDLVSIAPGLVVLVTSRERIGVPGERVFAVPPLSLAVGSGPGEPGGTESTPAGEHGPSGSTQEPGRLSDAATLFVDRTRAVSPTFQPDPAHVEEVCRRLDGLPLAIELAAARAASLGTDGLVTALDDRLRLLRAAGGGPHRHRSLRAVLDWSHHLLDDDERRVFRRLSVFSGSFDLSAATAVVADHPRRGVAGPDVSPDVGPDRTSKRTWGLSSGVADLVGRLADKSLVVRRDEGNGSRWLLLDTVRDYAAEHLAAGDDGPSTRRRHFRWAVDTALDLRDRMAAGDEWRESFRQVEADLRAALAAGPPGAPIADAASAGRDGGHAGTSRGPAHHTGGTGENAPQGRDRLELAFALAALQTRTGSYTVAQDAYESAIGLARRVGGPEAVAEAALGASVSGMMFGVSDRSRVDWLEEGLAALDQEPGALRVRLQARLAMELYWSTDRPRSLALAHEALADARVVRDDAALAEALYALHYTTRGPESTDQRLALSTEIVQRAERGDATELALAGRAAHVVDLLSVGDLTGMDAALGMLWEAADRLQRPAFQWYTDTYRVVRALLEGRFDDADARATTAIAAGRNVAEFSVGLYFAEAITDLRDLDPGRRRQRVTRLDDLARRFPGVLAWRCRRLLDELALLHPGPRTVTSGPLPTARHDGVVRIRSAARSLAEEVLDPSPRDAHWVVEACLLAEVAAELGDAHLAARLDEALRPHAGQLAVAGRVGACRGAVVHALGLARLALDDLDGAITDLQAAVAQHDQLGARPFLARSLSALVHALELRGDPDDRTRAATLRRRVELVGAELRPHVLAVSPP